jgi:hypothetical protein
MKQTIVIYLATQRIHRVGGRGSRGWGCGVGGGGRLAWGGVSQEPKIELLHVTTVQDQTLLFKTTGWAYL